MFILTSIGSRNYNLNMFLNVYFCAIFLLTHHQKVDAYSSRVPVNEQPTLCSKMIPHHGVEPQTSTHNYKIEIHNRPDMCYKDGSKIVGEIVATDGKYFEGFMVQARAAHGRHETGVGHFCNRGLDLAERLTCDNRNDNTLGHRTNVHRNSTVFDWHADRDMDYDFRFVATIVKNKTTFWTHVASHLIRFDRHCTDTGTIHSSAHRFETYALLFILTLSIAHMNNI